jgi:hypothetical protein
MKKKQFEPPPEHRIEKGKIAVVLRDTILWKRLASREEQTAFSPARAIKKGEFVWVISDPILSLFSYGFVQASFYQVFVDEGFFWIKVREVVNPHYNEK